jgi:2'-5' RNA ligase
MSNLVIVAIPDENDRVWKVSSEKIPHMTLLFLGEVDEVANLDQIMLYVEHAASTTLRRFYLPVDRRGELGADQADVLFFKKGRYDFKAIRDFRAALLQDNNIKTAYDSATQFEGPWNPHLTLGYPETPAKKISDEQSYPFYDVQFNKIAVWTGDYEGPDFLLKDYGEEFNEMEIPMDVAMSDIHPVDSMAQTADVGAAFLAHYGVKGMRWGVRKDPTTGLIEGETKREGVQRYLNPQGHALSTDVAKVAIGVIVPLVAPLTIPAQVRLVRGGARGIVKKREAKADVKFEKVAKSQEGFVAIHNGAVDKMNRDLGGINKKYESVDLTKDAVKQKAYDDEVFSSMRDAYRESANTITNKRADRHLDLDFKENGLDFSIKVKDGPPPALKDRIKHAAIDGDDVTFVGKIKRIATGHIVGFEFPDFDKDAKHSVVGVGSEFILEHYGIKGMRWGVRNKREMPSAVTPRATSIVPHGSRRRTKVKTEGGENHPASDDAVKVAEARVKLKKSGTAALSNQELRDVANRLQLENQVAVLTSSRGKQFVTRQFETESQNLARAGIKTGVRTAAPHVKKKAKKAAATAAVAALL